MNKTESVSIGRRGFVCEQDAYAILQKYLERSAHALKDDPDKDEILADLELSMAGHIAELSKELVVDKSTALKVIDLMGEVAQEEKDTSVHGASPDSSAQDKSWEEKLRSIFKKPLYKDRSRKIVDGVCSGIARTVDIDPLWVRLVFVFIIILTRGGGVAFYILLSILMKDAAGAKDKKTAGEVIENVKEKLENATGPVKSYEVKLRRIIVFFLKFIWNLLRVFVCLVLVVCSIAWASTLFFMLGNPSGVDVFGGAVGWLEFAMVFSAGLLLLIPIFELLSAMIRPRRFNSRVTLSLWSVWALSLIIALASAVNVFPKVQHYIITEKPKNKFLYTQVHDGKIMNWCFSPLGTCSSSQLILKYEERCGIEVSVYSKEDRIEWMSKLWGPTYKNIEVPVSEEQYCEIVKKVYAAAGGDVIFSDEKINDPIYTQTLKDPITGVEKNYWYMEYMTRDL